MSQEGLVILMEFFIVEIPQQRDHPQDISSLYGYQMSFFKYILLLAVLLTSAGLTWAADKIIIAENGAGRELIEHTLPALTLAIARDVNVIEIHTVMTADNHLIVYRDITLNRLTNVANIFPGRSRDDGGYYVVDFSLAEIRQLRLRNVFETEEDAISLGIPTLVEELSLIRKLEGLLDKSITLVLGISQPWHFGDNGKDISSAVLDTLLRFSYVTEDDGLLLECFDPDELRRIHDTLMPARQMRLPLIQLIGENDGSQTKTNQLGNWEPYNYDWMFTFTGLRIVASYAWAIGLPGNIIVDDNGLIPFSGYLDEIKKYGLKLFVYGLRDRADEIPAFAGTFESLLDFYYQQTNIDGISTDSFTTVKSYQQRLIAEEKRKADLPEFFSTLQLSRPPIELEETE